ncbi:MAG: pyruvate kinase [Candidatus Parvarchaeota archaeon]|nr:pyruvate kinase [Candidatus Rehaiarchaeum fermentans]MCW1293132.1 pyruvate kinase [Candidatus Rehaiarchaeum fermentans]MCW1293718.1 pyruvate kinase [Candidatus Rehaiarchaeum fermentans]
MEIKIIATLGPNSKSESVISELVKNGVDIIRINTSHIKDEEELRDYIRKIRKISNSVSILLDLPGPKLRTQNTEPITIEKGKVYKIGENGDIKAEWESLKGLKKDKILKISDGKLQFKCLEVGNRFAIIKALNSGVILEKQSINYSGITYKKGLTDLDLKFAKLAIKYNADIIAISFVRSKDEILELRRIVGEIPIIAKIEEEEGLKNIEEICDASEGIMVARGDLALNIKDMFTLPSLQKKLIRVAKEKRKAAIVATQLLSSMVNNPYPLRAEILDVSNAIYEGADALMLSEETAIGKYPIESVKTLKRIINDYNDETLFVEPKDLNDKIAKAALDIAQSENINDLIAITRTGSTAIRLSIFGNKNIFALVDNSYIYNRLKLYRNIIPILKKGKDQIKEILKSKKIKKTIIVGSEKEGGTTTYIKLEYL